MNFINICRPKKEDAYLPSRTYNSISLIDEEMEILFPQEILGDDQIVSPSSSKLSLHIPSTTKMSVFKFVEADNIDPDESKKMIGISNKNPQVLVGWQVYKNKFHQAAELINAIMAGGNRSEKFNK